MTDEQMHADKGYDWHLCSWLAGQSGSGRRDHFRYAAETLREVMHDRDRFSREAAYWLEECIELTGEALA